MLYQPAKVKTIGTKNESLGVGIITPNGAYLTSSIPPFQRIGMTAFLPKNTLFKRSTGTTEVLHVAREKVKGKYPIPLQVKPTSISKFSLEYLAMRSLDINITSVKDAEYDILITEESPGVFEVKVQTKMGNYIQPVKGWVWKG